jgi:hypothetical protein
MLTISSRQEKQLNKEAYISFQHRMVNHISEFFPEHYNELGEEKLYPLIEHCVENCEQYQIVSERDVCLYIDMSLALGLDFEKSEEHAWATDLLTDADTPNATERINSTYDKAIQILTLKEQEG